MPKATLTLNISWRSAELTGPLNHAKAQLKRLDEWFRDSHQSLLEPGYLQAVVKGLHPDMQFDRITRGVVDFGHHSQMWLQWENGEFDRQAMQLWIQLAMANGRDDWADMSSIDFRQVAMINTAQLALYEGDGLQAACEDSPQNAVDIWRRLYWFTRFFLAWEAIQSPFSQAKWAANQRIARTARSWKKKAWAYYREKMQKAPNSSIRTIATNFVAIQNPRVSINVVQTYLGEKLSLATGKGASIVQK